MPMHVSEFFAPQGPLARALPSYEPRPQQLAVAEAVQAALAEGRKLVAEAGTGTGKTLAYLVPALHSGLKVVVSTGTKNLQDQLVQKDLPLVQKALGRSLAVEVMKGRTNYLCELRAERVLAQQMLPGMAQGGHWQRLRAWRQETFTGDRTELNDLPDDAPIWRQVSTSSEQCLGRSCAHYDRCWVTQMRRRAQTASVVIVNHHLYLADAALRQDMGDEGVALLPQHDVVIFDEAHELDEIAAQHFGYQVSERRLQDLEQDVQQAAAGHGTLPARLLPALQALQNESRTLYDLMPFVLGRQRLRDDFLTDGIIAQHQTVDTQLQRLEAELAGTDEDETKTMARRVAALAAELAFVLGVPGRQSLVAEQRTQNDDAPTYVRYSEASTKQRSLVARPVDVAGLLGKVLARTPAVFVSATLRVGKGFGHFRQRVGLGEAAELCVESPFDYAEQAALYLPRDLPEPDHAEFTALAGRRVAELLHASGGGAFVLCTSHRALQAMRAAAEASGVGQVLVQGDAPKAQLIHRFRKHGDAVLVATMSFWKGVDVPGSALRLVILDKLPFASPADPVVEARLEHLTGQGLDPFMTYQLPHASLLLRQGFGRLIRTQRDRGMVALLDRRVSTRRYGPLLLRSLPACQRLHDLPAAQAFLRANRPAPTTLRESPRSAGYSAGSTESR